MWLLNQSSSAARTALVYITAGAFTVIWTGVWYIYLRNNPPETNTAYYFCSGFLISGLALLVIGFGLGRIGRAARHADMPAEVVAPTAVVPAARDVRENLVAGAPAVAPVPQPANPPANAIHSQPVPAAVPIPKR